MVTWWTSKKEEREEENTGESKKSGPAGGGLWGVPGAGREGSKGTKELRTKTKSDGVTFLWLSSSPLAEHHSTVRSGPSSCLCDCSHTEHPSSSRLAFSLVFIIQDYPLLYKIILAIYCHILVLHSPHLS